MYPQLLQRVVDICIIHILLSLDFFSLVKCINGKTSPQSSLHEFDEHAPASCARSFRRVFLFQGVEKGRDAAYGKQKEEYDGNVKIQKHFIF
jgi:hypothetical protein